MTVQAAGLELDESYPIEGLLCEQAALTASLPEVGVFDPDDPGYGGQLSDEVAVLAYQALEEQLTPTTEQIVIDLSAQSITDWGTQVYPSLQAALAAYVFDHPECQYCSIRRYGRAGDSAVYIVTQNTDAQARKDALDAVLADFAAGFDTSLPTVVQYKAIHDYVCELAVYNYEAASAGVLSEAHTAFGLLVDGDAVVCEGYSKAFKVLCDAVGLPCMLVAGEAVNGWDFSGVSNHMWNLVQLEDKWYAVDTTWDDIDNHSMSDCPGLELSMVCYDYFLNNDPFCFGSEGENHRASGLIYFAHSWPMEFSLPALAEDAPPAVYTTDRIVLTMLSGDLSVPEVFWRKIINGIYMSSIRDITFRLTQDVTLAETFLVPADYRYTIDNSGGLYAFSAPQIDIQGQLHLTARPHHCLPYPGGILTVAGEPITEDFHWYDTCSDTGEEHTYTCTCTRSSYSAPHEDADENFRCDLCDHIIPIGPSVILSFKNGSVTFRAGEAVTGVAVCVAGYEHGKCTGAFFLTIDTTPGQRLTRDVPLAAASYKVFLLDPLTMAPLCNAFTP